MRLVAPPAINTDPLEAYRASMRAWLVRVLAWLGAAFGALAPSAQRCALVRAAVCFANAWTGANLRRGVRDLRRLAMVTAFGRLSLAPPRTHQKRYPGAERQGLRRGRLRVRLVRQATSGAISAMHCGSLRQRATRLAAMLDDFEALVARVLKRMRVMWRCPHGARLIQIAARDACFSCAAPNPPACADTS